ncbi:hypothetical protein NM688_g1929 [Phlebia brevispora]|uniref:Uncharacterized protein n=1 Tax=Phlebia brevispora TaxID=194682 RepID=A0ACC1TAB7_9APHY|nr:hypothetical protein NM688_g1929 [Phlebia brevispora]
MALAIVQQFLEELPPSLQWPVHICAYTTVACYVLSVITGNVSQVDRIWTFMPTIYTAYFALLPFWPKTSLLPLFPYTPEDVLPAARQNYSPRALLMLGLTMVWMFRLSYNTWRRGLFNLHDEDYRWAVLRQRIPTWFFQVVNITFIAAIQNVILLLLGIPTYFAVFQQPTQLATSDYILAALALIDLTLEFTADNQQYSYQTYKHTGVLPATEWPFANLNWTAADLKRGFVTRGLWAWSRHPNFLCEQTFWIIITLFPILSPESPRLAPLSTSAITPIWPLAPALVLCTLFFSSTIFTESISLSKYPEGYRAYQKRVAMFIPFLTPAWGFLLQLQGKKAEVDELVYGENVPKIKGKDE